jgi:RNA polymerase sigma-70 factor (ECF subfamily)
MVRSEAHAMSVPAASDASPSTGDDSVLMALVAAGDREALGALYGRLAPRMMAVAARMLDSLREAEDLVHDVFLEAWLHAAEYDPARGSVRTWLLMRLRSRAIDRLGRAATARNEALFELAAPEPPAAAGVIEPSDSIWLQQAVERLDADVRDVLELTYFRGLTAEALAVHLGIPVGTVRSRLARGLRSLRLLLDGPEQEGST